MKIRYEVLKVNVKHTGSDEKAGYCGLGARYHPWWFLRTNPRYIVGVDSS
jgi:hypothetical protein